MLDNNKILILFVDAFSFSYINKNDTPFLAKTDVKPLRPAFGFKQLAAAFTGLPSWTTGWYSEYIYEPKTSPYRWTRLLPPLLEKASGSFGRVLIDIFTKIITGRKNLSSRSIPLQLTRYFGVNEAPYPKSSNLVSYLNEKKLSYRFILFPEVKTNQEAFQIVQAFNRSKQRPELLLVHFPELDPITHKFGIESIQCKEEVRKLDHMIATIADDLGNNTQLMIFSDHGMIDVIENINILQLIKGIGEISQDYIVFLDSIIARFWFFRKPVIKSIFRILSKDPRGHVIRTKQTSNVWRDGHFMFVCNPGYIIFPNYFDRTPPKSMHGYPSSPKFVNSLNGILSVNKPELLPMKSQLSMIDIMSILTRMINRSKEVMK